MAAGAVFVPQIVALNYVPSSSSRKHGIDIGTKIEISTETPGSSIYFTLDGTRPGESGRSTRKYRYPFTLPSGKYTVRAIAVAPDGRESAVASKGFFISGPKGEHSRAHNNDTPRSDRSMFLQELSSRSDRHHTVQPSAKDAFTKNLYRAWTEEQGAQQRTHSKQTVDDIYKYANTGMDTKGRSATMPDTSQPRSQAYENGDFTQLYTCARCGLRLPSGASRCVVCECDSVLVTQLPQTPVPTVPVSQMATLPATQTSLPPWSGIVCVVCGANNVKGTQRCVACFALIPPHDTQPSAFLGTTTTAMTTTPSSATHVRCNSCARLNDARARFCDWCAGKLIIDQQTRPETVQLCSKCASPLLSPNRPCLTCGTLAVSGPREFDRFSNAGSSIRNGDINYINRRAQDDGDFIYKMNKGTQTTQVGSFVNLPSDNPASNYTPRGTVPSVSPGRGYWRQQLKHINAQLEAFASSSNDFRAAIGPHQLGRLLAARVTNSGGDEFVVRLVFSMPNVHAQRSHFYNRDTARSRTSARTYADGINGYSKYEAKRPSSTYSSSSMRNRDYVRPAPKAKSSLARYAMTKKYSDADDYAFDRKIDRLRLDEPETFTEDDDEELVTATSDEEDETTDRDILDTFREDPTGFPAYRRSINKTNHRFVVSSTPRRAGRKSASRTNLNKKRAAAAYEEQAGQKPAVLALKELGVDGAGRISKLSRLFDESGVDPAMRSRDGWSLAHLAVINRHPDCIPVIAQHVKGNNDAVVDALSCRGPSNAYGNTPLHEAVRLSTSSTAAMQALDLLLSCGADVLRKNERGETAFEYAQRIGHMDAAKRIAANMGQRRLKAAGLGQDGDSSKRNDKLGLSD